MRALALAAVGCAAGAALASCAPPPPCTHSWDGPTGGSFGAAANWDTNTVPGPTSVACTPAGSTIVIDGAQSVGSLQALGTVRVPLGTSLAVALAETESSSKIAFLDLDGGTITGTGNVHILGGTSAGGSIATTGLVGLSGEVTIAGDTTIASPTLSGANLRVTGTTHLEVSAAFVAGSGSIDLVHSGSVLRVAGGTGTVNLNGTRLLGRGWIAGNLAGQPVLEPGGSATGSLRITRAWSPSGGQLVADIGSASAYDAVVVGTGADLDAVALTVTADPAYVPDSGDHFDVVTAGSITSPFLTTALPAFADHTAIVETSPIDVIVWITDCDAETRHPGADLKDESLAGEVLRGCDLAEADLGFADLTDVDFTNANLTDANLAGATLTGATWSNTTCPDGTNSDVNAGTCEGHTPLVLTVNDATVDAVDAAPGDGVCETAVPGVCTLRAAIQETNVWPGADTVRLVPDTAHAVTILGDDDDAAAGDFDITDPLRVEGRRATVAPYTFTAFADVTMFDLVSGLTSNGDPVALTRFTGYVDVSNATIDESDIYGWIVGGASTVRASRLSLGRLHDTAVEKSYFHGGWMDLVGATISDSTFDGGGVSAYADTPESHSFVVRSTFISAIISSNGGLTISDSIVDFGDGPDASNSCNATSAGRNVDSHGVCGFDQPTDLIDVDPLLLPVADNGGPVPTARPMDGSPAIDTGLSGCTGTDARQQPRPTDGDGDGLAACDRGAYEAEPWVERTFVVTSTSDKTDATPGDGQCETDVAGECTLRAAVQEANAVAGRDTVALVPGATYPLLLPGGDEDDAAIGDLDVFGSLRVEGDDTVVSRVSGGYVFAAFGRTLTLDGLDVTGDRGGLEVRPGAEAVVDDSTLDGIANHADLQVSASHLTGEVRSANFATFDRVTFTDVSLWLGDTWDYLRYRNRATTISASTWVGKANDTDYIMSPLLIDSSTFTGEKHIGILNGDMVTVTNSVFAILHETSSCSGYGVISGGHNVFSTGFCVNHPAASDLVATDPMLTPLGHWGGRFPSYALRPGSPAIDAGRPTCGTLDTRGFPRPIDGDGDGQARCDRGAVEMGAPTPLTIAVDSTIDAVDAAPGDGICATATGHCTLRAAIQEANVTIGADTIGLGSGLTYPLDIPEAPFPWGAGDPHRDDSGDLDIHGPVRIVGDESTVLGLTTSSDLGIFEVRAGSLELDHLTVRPRRQSTDLITTRSALVLRDVDLGGAAMRADGCVVVDAGTAVVERSALSNCLMGVRATGGATSIQSSTIADNGLAIWRQGGTVEVSDSTMVNSYGIITSDPGSVVLRRSILRATEYVVCGTVPLTSDGHNLVSDASCGLTGPTDLQGVDANLGALADNGGSTPSMLPLPGSPAIDSAGLGCSGTDQRGVARPQGSACDRGAVEQ